MKKLYLLLIALVLIAMFIGCTKTTPAEKIYAQLKVEVSEFMTGPALSEAKVIVMDAENKELLGENTTDENGYTEIDLEWSGEILKKEAIVKVEAKDFAPSEVRGLCITGSTEKSAINEVKTVQMVANRAMIDPDTDELPAFSFQLKDSEGNNLDPSDIATSVTVIVESQYENDWENIDVLYIGLGYIPWAGRSDKASFGATSLEVTYDLEGKSGTLPLHIVAYDYNRGRVDQIINMNFEETADEIDKKYAPTGTWVYSLTTDANVEFYSLKDLPSDVGDREIRFNELKNKLDDKNTKGNIFNQIAWNIPATNTGIYGYNVYRSDSIDGEWTKIAFTKNNYAFDNGIGVKAGNQYFYKVRSVYTNGEESENSNIVEVVPLDNFGVKLISPANRAVDVSRKPLFRWKPTDKYNSSKSPILGGGLLKENEIYYGYYLWIYDTVQSDGQHVFPYDMDEKNNYEFYTFGPSEVAVEFLDPEMTWLFVYNNSYYQYPFDALESYKTYEWGLDVAYAQYIGKDKDEDGNADAVCLSVAIDWGYDFDRWINEPDYYNRFTTGNDY